MLDPLRLLREHQGAARLLDRALRRARPDDRAGRAHPRPPRRDARRGRGRRAPRPAPGRGLRSSTTRTRAGRTCPTSRSSRAPTLGFAVTRAHHADVGGVEPGSMPADSRTLADEGVVIPPTRLDDEHARRPRRAGCATPTSAAATSARSSPRTAWRAGASPSCASAAAETASSRRWTSSTPTRSASSEPRSRASPTAATRREDVLEAPERRARDPRRGHDRGRRDRVRLRRHGAAARGQPQLPARGHALGLLLRRPLPDRTRPARLRRRVRAGASVDAPEGSLVNARPPAAVAAGNVETSSRIVDVALRRARAGASRSPRRARGR